MGVGLVGVGLVAAVADGLLDEVVGELGGVDVVPPVGLSDTDWALSRSRFASGLVLHTDSLGAWGEEVESCSNLMAVLVTGMSGLAPGAAKSISVDED